MKPEEIRAKIGSHVQNHGPCTPEQSSAYWNSSCAVFLAEIAAQLAEHNEYLKRLAYPKIEVSSPRWVWLTYCQNSFPIDVSKVVGIAERGNDSVAVFLHGVDNPWHVDGTVLEVSQKLGIPMEGNDAKEPQEH